MTRNTAFFFFSLNALGSDRNTIFYIYSVILCKDSAEILDDFFNEKLEL